MWGGGGAAEGLAPAGLSLPRGVGLGEPAGPGAAGESGGSVRPPLGPRPPGAGGPGSRGTEMSWWLLRWPLDVPGRGAASPGCATAFGSAFQGSCPQAGGMGVAGATDLQKVNYLDKRGVGASLPRGGRALGGDRADARPRGWVSGGESPREPIHSAAWVRERLRARGAGASVRFRWLGGCGKKEEGKSLVDLYLEPTSCRDSVFAAPVRLVLAGPPRDELAIIPERWQRCLHLWGDSWGPHLLGGWPSNWFACRNDANTLPHWREEAACDCEPSH